MSKKRLGGTIAAILSATLLYISFHGIDWKAFLTSMASCRWPLMVLSAVVGSLVPACRALRWRRTVEPFFPAVKRSDSICANYVSYLVNMAVPYTREATRCVLMHRKAGDKASYDKLVGVELLEKACDLMCLLLLLVATAVISSGKYMPFLKSRFAPEKVSGTVIILILATFLVIASILIVRRYKDKNSVCSKICGFFSGIKVGLGSIAKLNSPWIYVVETIVLWSMYWLQLYLGAMAMPSLVSVSASDCLFLAIAVALSSLVPVPGGFGAYHIMIASAISALCSIPWNDGLAYATLVHESQTLLLALCGLISTLYFRE